MGACYKSFIKDISLIHSVGVNSSPKSWPRPISGSCRARPNCSLLLKADCAGIRLRGVAFLLKILQHIGFPRVWPDWLSTLFTTTTRKVLLNGALGEKICHASR
jgi:hypothetical protein